MNAGETSCATYYAPAERDSVDELQRKSRIVAAATFLQETIDAMPDLVLILNGNRQVVSANRHVLETLACGLQDVLGKRPGELVGCHNASTGPDGCGTSRECMTCGAVNAILKCRESDQKITRECRVSLEDPVGGALDLRVSATAVDIDGERFTICVLKDISDEKRLAVMARLFFHDVMNTAGGIQGYTELLRERFPADSPEDQELHELSELAEQLIDEIRAQRDLTYAESGELEPELDAVVVRELLQHLQAAYGRHPVARGRHIVLGDLWPGEILTDRRLLGRVLGNMIKNALEAIRPGSRVTLSCQEDDDCVVCRVHNPGVIPPDIQMQVFQRSFSTKAAQGRGIGTHSMKLLGERYLYGKVSFVSRDPDGTTFWIRLPKSGPPDAT